MPLYELPRPCVCMANTWKRVTDHHDDLRREWFVCFYCGREYPHDDA